MSEWMWETKTIHELGGGKSSTVQTGPFGSQLHADDYVEDGVPFILIRNIGDNGLKVDALPRISCSDAKRLAKYSLNPGDIVFSRVGRTGSCLLISDDEAGWIISGQTLRLRLENTEIDCRFLLYALRSHEVQKFVSNSSVGTTRESLNTKIIESIPIYHPKLPQQCHIAEILSTLDEMIEQTDALIAKTQQIKAGLMHDLFTRGVTPDGHLRPTREHAPDLYKESPLGWLPRDWEAEKLGEILRRCGGYLQTGPFGSQLHAHEYQIEGVPVVMPQDINNGLIGTEQIARIYEARANELARHRMSLGDIVIARRGDLSRAAAITESEQGWVCGTGCFLLRLGQSALTADFAAQVYRQGSVQRQIAGRAVGTTMPSLNNSVMAGLFFPFCDEDEQVRIVERLEEVEQSIRVLCDGLFVKRQIKQGLMQDLLTGSVIVNPET